MAIHRALASKVPIDVWMGDFDSCPDPTVTAWYDIQRIYTPDQSKTDLEKAVEYVLAAGYQKVYILWATGRRVDHTLTNLTNMIRYRKMLDIILLDDYAVSTVIPSGFSQGYPKGTQLSLMSIGIVTGGLVRDSSMHCRTTH